VSDQHLLTPGCALDPGHAVADILRTLDRNLESRNDWKPKYPCNGSATFWVPTLYVFIIWINVFYPHEYLATLFCTDDFSQSPIIL